MPSVSGWLCLPSSHFVLSRVSAVGIPAPCTECIFLIVFLNYSILFWFHPNSLEADGANLSSHGCDRCRDKKSNSPVAWSEALSDFNNWPSYWALVSLLISSNLLTRTVFFAEAPVCYRKDIAYSVNKGAFQVQQDSRRHCTVPPEWGLTFHFILATREMCSIPKGLSPSLWHSQGDSLQLQTAHRTDKPLRSTFVIAVK